MNFLSFIESLFCRFFYGNAFYETKKLSQKATHQILPLPQQIIAQIPVYQTSIPSLNTQPLQTRSITTQPISSPIPSPFAQSIPFFQSPLNPSFYIPSSSENNSISQNANQPFEGETALNQSLQNQINQMQKDNENLLAEITIKPSTYSLNEQVLSLSHLIYEENVQKQLELTQIHSRLENVSHFCNQEMVEVLNLVTKGHQTLAERLKTLREITPFIGEDKLLFENIEQINVLEQADDALKQLENKFQVMQKSTFNNERIFLRNEQETSVNYLLEKIEKLNRHNQFLQESKQNLPAYAIYKKEELQELIETFEKERADLLTKVKNSRQKLIESKQFTRSLTNHLLDYATIFKDHFQKLKRFAPISELPMPLAQKMPLPQQIVVPQKVPKADVIAGAGIKSSSRIQNVESNERNDNEIDSKQLREAAYKVVTAINELLKIK
jgi:hypothetical protein